MANASRSTAVALSAAALLALAPAVPATAPAAGTPPPRAAKTGGGRPDSILVSYDDLLDRKAVIRSGRSLAEAVGDKRTPKAFLQPFLEGYSALLPYAVQMVFGPDPSPRRDVVERWPPGSPQPAWVALFRGRYRAVADAEGRVRLFLPGDDAVAAWKTHYPAVRHCLAALAASSGGPLEIEVFAYRNDYRKRELRLFLRPAAVAGDAFPPDRVPFDPAALEDFFRQGGQLEGARLDPGEGLVLFASQGRRETLSGEPVGLADLAVAYRAVFHAGDNDAFVSLDPNADPTLASVNFGGHLEDTRIGAAVLAADRRFKTICSGLDPVTHEDVRAEIRRAIPEFMSNSERAFLGKGQGVTGDWVSSRYWFYPESVSVDADPRGGFAVITRPRFTADAERIGKDFEGLDARRKRAALPPEARENIRQLNAEHERYAAAFPEIRDLTPVARLMALATWLKRSETSGLDLDALLAVELPAAPTPRTLERVVSTEYVAVPPSGELSAAAVRETSGVIWMTPLLQRTVGDFFRDARTFTAWYCARRKGERRPCSSYEDEAAALFEERRGQPLLALLDSDAALFSLLEFLAGKLVYPLPPEGEAERAAQVADGERIGRLRQELERVRAELAAAGEPAPAAPAAERDALEGELAAIMKRYHDGAGAASWHTLSRIQVNGGISLRPGEFTVRKDPGSKELKEFKRKAQSAPVVAGATAGPAPAESGDGGGRLVRSRPTGKAAAPGGVAATPAAAPPTASGGKAPAARPASAESPAAKPAATRPAPPPAANGPATAAKSTRPSRGAASKPAPAAAAAPAGKGAGAPAAGPAPVSTPASTPAAPGPTAPAPAASAPVAVAMPARDPSAAPARVAVPAGAAGAVQAFGELAADGRIVFRKSLP